MNKIKKLILSKIANQDDRWVSKSKLTQLMIGGTESLAAGQFKGDLRQLVVSGHLKEKELRRSKHGAPMTLYCLGDGDNAETENDD